MGQHSGVSPTGTGVRFPAHVGTDEEHATATSGSHVVPPGWQENVGQQSAAVPIARVVPGGHAGAGVAGQGLAAVQTGWQLR